MNPLELFFYNLVKRYPRLKTCLRSVYQRVCALVPVRKYASVYEIDSRPGYFFGYYDKSPWSPCNTLLLAHGFSIPVRRTAAHDEVQIGYFRGEAFYAVGSTNAWNWQQGAMLQWLGPAAIIYNIYDGKQHRARLVDLNGRERATLPRPVAAVSPDGTRALSYSFSRLRRAASGYGYANGNDSQDDQAAPAGDGLYGVEIPSGTSRMICSLRDMAHYRPDDTMRNSYHYFNHCCFSPSGDRLVFLHRWQQMGREWTRMLTCGWNGEDLWIFPTSEMVSHFTWRDDQHILAWARVAGVGDGYFLFKDRTPDFSRVGEDFFSSDGHPTYSRDGRWILTDTYPDRFRVSQLILYDTQRKQPYVLARLYSPFQYDGDVRCDLHPRWNRNDTMICFDSTHVGVRSLCTMQLASLPPESCCTKGM